MKDTLAFDVYGTLIDTHGVMEELRKHLGDAAADFSTTWRSKQLEYSFRRGLMQAYEDFDRCTRDGFRYACAAQQVSFSEEEEARILGTYRTLPAYPDVADGLQQLREAGHRLFAFSNGLPGSVKGLLENAGIEGFFLDVISADEIKTFKPDPAIYAHLLQRTSSSAPNTWLVSSNPFDVIGACAFGLQAAWVQRTPEAVFDPWGIEPSRTVTSLTDLAESFG